MIRIALFSLLLAFPAATATAKCTGANILDSLPEAERAAMDASIAELPFAYGNAWTAYRGDEVIHIVGTYHLDDPRHDAVLERLAPAIDSATTLLVEAGPDEETRLKAEMSRDPSLLFLTSGPTLPEQLSEDEWQALSAAMNTRGIPAFLASKMQPWYVSMMLGIPACAMADMAKGVKGLDGRIIARAEQADVPIRALEPYDTVFRLFDGMAAEIKLDMIRTSLAMDGQAEDYTATLADAYFSENVRVTWELGRLAAYD
ncbi:MAG: TraB/GumN family protein, partial [Albidovulum sp.]|uniref:TraB/GumN family protein n=1 Tax=Albidovulum sp. TaxID=1872424 RepID=UPI003C874532